MKDVSQKKEITLVAHRGYSGKYPENTLIAYQAAYAHGARWMECDIQLTKDLKAIVQHDENLQRMAGVDLDIREVKAKKLYSYSAYYPNRFDHRFIGNPFCTLKQLSRWLQNHSNVKLFVEIKQHSIDSFGMKTCMKVIHKAIKKVKKQCIIISFDPGIVEYAKSKYGLQNGWVIPEWSDDVKVRADSMQSDFLFTSKIIMPEDSQEWWTGKWQWANYNVDVASEIPKWIEKGLTFIETNEIGDLMRAQNVEKYHQGQ